MNAIPPSAPALAAVSVLAPQEILGNGVDAYIDQPTRKSSESELHKADRALSRQHTMDRRASPRSRDRTGCRRVDSSRALERRGTAPDYFRAYGRRLGVASGQPA